MEGAYVLFAINIIMWFYLSKFLIKTLYTVSLLYLFLMIVGIIMSDVITN